MCSLSVLSSGDSDAMTVVFTCAAEARSHCAASLFTALPFCRRFGRHPSLLEECKLHAVSLINTMLCIQWKTCISNYLLYSNWIIMASWSKGNYLTFPLSWDLHNDDEYPVLLNLLFWNLLILLFVVLGPFEGQQITLPWRNNPSPIML